MSAEVPDLMGALRRSLENRGGRITLHIDTRVDQIDPPIHQHTWAWLTAGGQECTTCGAPRR